MAGRPIDDMVNLGDSLTHVDGVQLAGCAELPHVVLQLENKNLQVLKNLPHMRRMTRVTILFLSSRRLNETVESQIIGEKDTGVKLSFKSKEGHPYSLTARRHVPFRTWDVPRRYDSHAHTLQNLFHSYAYLFLVLESLVRGYSLSRNLAFACSRNR